MVYTQYFSGALNNQVIKHTLNVHRNSN